MYTSARIQSLSECSMREFKKTGDSPMKALLRSSMVALFLFAAYAAGSR